MALLFMDDAIRTYLQYLQFEKRRSQHSIEAYGSDLRQFADYTAAQYEMTDLQSITAPVIRSWLAHLRERGLEPRSLNRKLSAVKSFFRYWQKQQVLAKNPAASLESLKAKKQLPRYVEADALSGYFAQNDAFKDWDKWNRRTIMAILYQTGMRRAELVGLQERHLDISAGHLKVLGKGSKERIIPVGGPLMAQMQSYLREKRRLIREIAGGALLVDENGTALRPGYINRVVKQELSAITTIDKKSPHVLRHSFATHLLNNGADINAIKELLGHASLAATQVYTRNSIEKLKEVFRQAHPKA